MKRLIIILLLLPDILFSQTTKPAIVVLGVTHTGQLVSSIQQPAALRAFVKRVKPDAICIERSPEEYLRNDFYEFTYEQQYILVPYAKQQKIPVHPIDWIPKDDDVLLTFGIKDLEIPAFTRNPGGFLGFIAFGDSSILHQPFYYAEDSIYRSQIADWYTTYRSKQTNLDFARRLFVYRTFLQAKRIDLAARSYTQNDTLLVVIGSFHKDDVERILSGLGYPIINSANFGTIPDEEIKNNYELADAFAIATFNLLGMQSKTNVIDRNLLAEAIRRLRIVNSPETAFFETKYLLFDKKINSKEAINKYKTVLKSLPNATNFTWTGVKNKLRLDSYFDPFGNMTLQQRIHLELAREYFKNADTGNYNKEKELLLNELQGFKKAMLIAYWPEYVEK